MIKFNIPYTSKRQTKDFQEVIEGQKFSGGGSFSEKVQTLLLEKYGFQNTYLTTSCTAAIQLCAMAIDFTEGDEIIIPSYTFASTPSPFIITGAKIVLADCSPDYPNVSIESLKASITENTKAIMVVHYGGYSNNIEEIQQLCKQHNIILIEDAAQSIHGFHNGKALGSYGDFSVFSFHETKNINCGEGGLLVVNNPNYLNKIDQLYECGTNRTDFFNGKVKNYEWVSLGLSFTLAEINSAFLFSQLQEIDVVTEHRKNIWQCYYKELQPLENRIKIAPKDVINSNYHTFYICLKDNNELQNLQNFMKENGVLCYSHYYPLHQSVFAMEELKMEISLPYTDYFGSSILRLPLHHQLTIAEANQVTSLIKEYFENH